MNTAIVPISTSPTPRLDRWVANQGYWRCTNCGRARTGWNIRVSENTWLCHVCVSNNIAVGYILDTLIKTYAGVDFHIATIGRTLTIRTSVTNANGVEQGFAFNKFDVSQQSMVLEQVKTRLNKCRRDTRKIDVGGYIYTIREIKKTASIPVNESYLEKTGSAMLQRGVVCDGCQKAAMYTVSRGNFRYCEECALPPITMPDQGEIEWLAENFVRLLGKGTAKNVIVTITAELDTFVQNVNTGFVHATKLRDDVARAQEGLRKMRNDPACVFDHPAHDTWKDQMNKFRLVEWWAQTKRDIATLSADDRAGRQEELAWVQQVNDLVRKIDEGAIKLASWGVHPSAQEDELKSVTDEYVQTASGGTHSNLSDVIETVRKQTYGGPWKEGQILIAGCAMAPRVGRVTRDQVGGVVEVVLLDEKMQPTTHLKPGKTGRNQHTPFNLIPNTVGFVAHLAKLYTPEPKSVTAIVPVSERRTLIDVCWNAPNLTLQPLTPRNSSSITHEFKWGDTVMWNGQRAEYRVTAGQCGIIMLPDGLLQIPLRDIKLLRRNEQHQTLVACHICQWSFAGPTKEATTALAKHLTDGHQPVCAKCSKKTGTESVVGTDGKVYCHTCKPLRGYKKPEPVIEDLSKLGEAPSPETPAPKKIEQPKQDQIPMKQLSLF